MQVGVGSTTAPFFVDLEIVPGTQFTCFTSTTVQILTPEESAPAEPAYEGHLQMGNGLTTFNYVWHEWDWAENPEYRWNINRY
jgi:hypothetical protein